MKSKNPQKFFEVLYKANVLNVHFEEIYNLSKYDYKEENAFKYVMKKLKNSKYTIIGIKNNCENHAYSNRISNIW